MNCLVNFMHLSFFMSYLKFTFPLQEGYIVGGFWV